MVDCAIPCNAYQEAQSHARQQSSAASHTASTARLQAAVRAVKPLEERLRQSALDTCQTDPVVTMLSVGLLPV